MPELPEVETTKTSLTPLLGQQVTNVKVFQPKLRWSMPDDLTQLVDYTLDSVERRAKYLILNFIPLVSANTNASIQPEQLAPRQLLIHLGMSGSLQQHSYGTDKRKHDHLVVTFSGTDDSQTQLHYYDPRRFGSVLWFDDYGPKLLDHLGPEPLSAEFTADYLYHLIQRSNNPNPTSNNALTNNVSTTTANARKANVIKQPIKRAIKAAIIKATLKKRRPIKHLTSNQSNAPLNPLLWNNKSSSALAIFMRLKVFTYQAFILQRPLIKFLMSK